MDAGRLLTRGAATVSDFMALAYTTPAADLTRSLQLARGTPGDGLAWSPDSRWLTAALEGRIVLLTADGRSTTYVTPIDWVADHPVRLGAGTIWFAVEDGAEPGIWEVRVQ